MWIRGKLDIGYRTIRNDVVENEVMEGRGAIGVRPVAG